MATKKGPRWREWEWSVRNLTGDEKTEFIEELIKGDPCLKYLAFSTRKEIRGPREQIEWVPNFLAEHEEACCRQCLHKVSVVSESDPDPRKRWGYGLIADWAMVGWIEQCGGHVQVVNTPEGTYTITKCPNHPDLPFPPPYSVIEKFEPSDPSQDGYVVLEVDSEELFVNPRPVLQSLDEVGAAMVKSYAAELTRDHWDQLMGADDLPVRIRWNGQVKSLAPGRTLFSRYSELLKKHSNHPRLHECAPLRGSDGEEHTAHILTLRDLALKYDGRSWFAGYLSQTLKFRSIDKLRARTRDPLEQASSPSSEPLDEYGSALPEAPQKCDSSVSQVELETIQSVDQKKLLDRLRAALTPRQVQILDCRLSDVQIKDIAAELNLRRETVSRELARIREVATGLK